MKLIKTPALLAIIAVYLLLQDANAQTLTTYDFNTAGQLTSNFTALGSNKFSQQSGGGLSGTDSVVSNNTNSTGSRFNNSAFTNVNTTFSYQYSLYFQFNTGVSPTNNGNPIFIGLSNQNTTDVSLGSGGAAYHMLAGWQRTSASDQTGRLVFQNNVNGTRSTPTGTEFSLVDDNWYFLYLNYTYNGTDFTGSYGLQNSNAAGVLGSVIENKTFTNLANSGLATSTAYGFFGGQGGEVVRGIKAIDNVVMPIPEPGTFAMLLGGVGMLTLLRRRRS